MCKKIAITTVIVLFAAGGVYAEGGAPPGNVQNQGQQLVAKISQQSSTIAESGSSDVAVEVEGGDAAATSRSEGLGLGVASITSISKVEQRAPAVGVIPPYPPFWLPNGSVPIAGPVGNTGSVYETSWDAERVRQIRKVLWNLPWKGILEEFFTSPPLGACLETLYERKGFKIINTINDRWPRPKGKLLSVIEDVVAERKALLRHTLLKNGYVPLGDLKVEGDEQDGFITGFTGHNFTHDFALAHNVAISLLWPWDIDLLVFDGGTQSFGKGQSSYPGGSLVNATNHISLSAVGAALNTKSEIRAKPVFRCTAYRYDPLVARKMLVNDKIMAIKNAVLNFQSSPRTEEEKPKDLSGKKQEIQKRAKIGATIEP